MEEFITIKDNKNCVLTEKKSKFIANLINVSSVEEAENKIKELKKKYYDARHNCFAYRVLENESVIEKSSDDGEPSGTAGAPMLNILQRNNLCNVLIVVTRYFGGILLGTGGLVRAYSNSLIEAINQSEKVIQKMGIELLVELEYNEFEKFKYYCRKNDITIRNTNYLNNITCNIELEEDKKNKLMEDYNTKSLNIIDIKFLDKKLIFKSILK